MAEQGVFFSEEKTQMTFMTWSGFSPAAHAQETEIFCFQTACVAFFSGGNGCVALASRT